MQWPDGQCKLESGSIEVWVQDQVASMCCVLMQNNLLSLCFLQELVVQCRVKITQDLCEILFQI